MDRETGRRRRKFQQVLEAQRADSERMAQIQVVDANRAERAPELLRILEEFEQSGNVEAFKTATGQWSKRPGFESFGGVNGQMFINQMVNFADDEAELAQLLVDVLSAPVDVTDARRKITELVKFAMAVKKGAHPAPKRVPYVASFFWSLRAPDRWPCMWTSAEEMLGRLGWLVLTADHAENYARFASVLDSLDTNLVEAGHALYWLKEHPFTGLDASLVERCAENAELSSRGRPGEEQQMANARAVLGELALLGDEVEADVAAAMGRSVKLVVPRPEAQGKVRSDGWVAFRAGTQDAPALRVWANAKGVAVGLYPGWVRDE